MLSPNHLLTVRSLSACTGGGRTKATGAGASAVGGTAGRAGIEEAQRHLGERLTRVEEGQRGLEQRVEEGFAVVNRRIDELREFLLWGFGVTFAGMFALVGFVIWDRRSAPAPAVRRIQELEEREQRLEAALREYAAKSPELADSLRKMGLL